MTPTSEPALPQAKHRSALLKPAIALMNRLTYPRKFVLISVFFLANLTLVMYFLVNEFNDRIEFTVKELEGTRYLRPLVRLFLHAGEARRLARIYHRGDAAGLATLKNRLADIDDDLRAVETVDRALGASLQSTPRLSAIRQWWTVLKIETLDPASRRADSLYEDFNREIRAFYSHIGDVSNLILDPDLDTYYLMDAILLKLHEGQALLLELGIDAEGVALRKSLTPDERARFIVQLGLIRSNLDATRQNAEKVFNNNPSGTARPHLEKAYDNFVQVARTALDGIQRDLVDAKTPALAPDAASTATTQPLEVSSDLWLRDVAELDDLMGARVALYEGRRRIAWISTLLVLCLVGYLWLAFYAAAMGTVQNLEQASQRMLGADPGKEIVLETQDELGRVTRSFNAIAQRLRHEWEQATQDNARARAAEAGLLESEERTRLIIQAALDGVVTIDVEGRVVEWNPQATTIFGWARAEAVGKKLSELIVPLQHRAAHDAGLRRYLETGEGPVLNKRIEITALRRGGAEFPVELSITPLSQGKGAAFSAFIRDITDRKRNEEELRKAKEMAEESNRTKSEFLANMSHELRTPLNSIIGFSTVVLRGKGKSLPAQEALYVERILDNGKHLLGLINTILDLSKIEAGKVELNVVPIALDALVRDTVAQLEGRVVDKKVRLIPDLPSQIAPFPTDPEKLKQILINLVGNAIKFTEQGSVTVRLVVDPKNDVPRRIDIIDTGVGIPKDMLGRIFDAFQQVDTGMARKYEGTGLGLTISRSLSNLLGCRIEVESEIGKGSTFSLHLLPLSPPDRTSTTTTRVARPESADVHGDDLELRDKLVLVIDDEDDSRFLLRQYVSDCGCRVAEAGSGPEAIAKARLQKPDLITLDLMMPGMNGWETLRNLKADPALFDVPVVVVSIVGSENRGTIFGAADLLNKPVAREELCAVLRRNVKQGPSKVLIVDDDANARQIMIEYLSEEQAEIQDAANGQEALQRLERFTPDLIILDLMMPVMDGMTFLDVLRHDPRHFALPVVVATAKELTLQEMRQLETSVSVVLRKNNDLRTELGRTIRSLLRRQEPLSAPVPESKAPILVKVRAILKDMIPGFLETRRQEVKAIHAALGKEDFESIRVIGHNMKGIGSSYGFPPITDFGRHIEEAAIKKAPEDIRKPVAALADYLERVQILPE